MLFFGDALFDQWFVAGRGTVSKEIHHALRAENAKSIDLAALTPFKWTQMNIYGPYQHRMEICRVEQMFWLDCRKVPNWVEEGSFLLVFRKTDQSLHIEQHDRWDGDFYKSGAPRPVVPSKSVFLIFQEGPSSSALGRSWHRLEWSN